MNTNSSTFIVYLTDNEGNLRLKRSFSTLNSSKRFYNSLKRKFMDELLEGWFLCLHENTPLLSCYGIFH